jgi:protein-S-isoprenylcysteine O-methyltransferase Ste14
MESTLTSEGAALLRRLQNLVASLAVVGTSMAICVQIPYYRAQLEELYGWDRFMFTGMEFLITAAVVYSLLLGVYYLTEPAPGVSKSLRFWRVVGSFLRSPIAVIHQGLSPPDRLAVLATILKAYFAPMMVIVLLRVIMGAIGDAGALLSPAAWRDGFLEMFNRHGFWFVMQLMIVVDVGVFTAGYLIEMRRLNNEIRSVDPTLLGWTAALLCYFPFSTYITSFVLGRQVSDFPQFSDPLTHVLLNVVLLVFMFIYTAASVALGFKASNLTHRGVVTSWPYSMIRHPAYAFKNMAWWIGAIPVVTAAFSSSIFAGVSAVASVVGWSLLYILRALTEEDHLRSVDGEYDAYAQKVRYRFVPGIY